MLAIYGKILDHSHQHFFVIFNNIDLFRPFVSDFGHFLIISYRFVATSSRFMFKFGLLSGLFPSCLLQLFYTFAHFGALSTFSQFILQIPHTIKNSQKFKKNSEKFPI